MYSKNIFAAGALLSVVAAVPMKRDVVMYTETAIDIVTVPVTTTVWVNPGQAIPTGSNSHYGHRHTITSHVQSTVTIASAPASTPSSVETSAAASAPSSSEAPSSSPVEVAPTTPSTTAYVAPTSSSTTEYVAPTPSSTTEAAAPTTSTTEAAAPSATTYSSSGSGSSLSGAAAPGTSYTGDFTWYQDGLGACGLTNGPSDHIVAIAESLFDQYTPSSGNPNDNPLCGKTVTLTGVDGSAYPATIVDRCTGCKEADLDLSEDFFNTVTDNGDGRVHNMSWKFD